VYPADLQLQIMGLPDPAWTALVVRALRLEGVLSAGQLLARWEAAMEALMPEVSLQCSAL
jgi:hypothetical protein